MNSIREIQRLNKRELEQGIPPSASWHTDYRDTAYVNIGGLSFDLTEGDIITIFSQFGEPTFVKLARDKTTGKSRGFAWLKYEDQRSCDLAVDNLGGATILGRVIRVDHARYKKRDDEEEDGDDEKGAGNAPQIEKRPQSEDEKPTRPLLKEEIELQKIIAEHDDEDPMKEYLVNEKRAEVAKALSKQARKEGKSERRDRRHAGHGEHPKDVRRRDRGTSEDRHHRERRRAHEKADRNVSDDEDVKNRETYRRKERSYDYDYDSDHHQDQPRRRRNRTPTLSSRRRDYSSEDERERRKYRRSRSPR